MHAHQSTTASCLCGDIQITAQRSPKRVGICHCMDCRKHHGALFYAAAIFDMDDVRITGTANNYEGRYFCPRCGSSVYAISSGEVEIHLGAMETPSQFTPTYECWGIRREAWLPDFPNARRYPGDRTDPD